MSNICQSISVVVLLIPYELHLEWKQRQSYLYSIFYTNENQIFLRKSRGLFYSDTTFVDNNVGWSYLTCNKSFYLSSENTISSSLYQLVNVLLWLRSLYLLMCCRSDELCYINTVATQSTQVHLSPKLCCVKQKSSLQNDGQADNYQRCDQEV